MTDRFTPQAFLVRIGIVAIAFAVFTALLVYAAASRGTGNWGMVSEPTSWVWMGVVAFAYGFWGYGSILISAISPKQLGRTLFMVLGALYLLFMAYIGFDGFSGGEDEKSLFFSVLFFPLVSAVFMIPLYLVIMVIGRVAG